MSPLSPAADYAAMAIMMLVCAVAFAIGGIGSHLTGTPAVPQLCAIAVLVCIISGPFVPVGAANSHAKSS